MTKAWEEDQGRFSLRRDLGKDTGEILEILH